MIRDALLALGLLLSTASQLRPEGTPIGPGEFCLAIWVILSIGYEAIRLGPPATRALSRLLIFWLVFAFAQCLGLLVGFASEEFRDTAASKHDMLAYLLMASISCFIVIVPDTGARLRRVTWIVAAAGATCLAVQVADAFGLVTIPAISPWYWNRFRGWSENPNQMALLSVALALLSLHLAETAEKLGERFAALACAGFCFLVGVLTRSDSFILVLLIAGPMFVTLKLRTWLSLRGRGLPFRTACAYLIILSVPALLASAAPFAPRIAAHSERFATNTLEDNNQGEDRFKLWTEAIHLGVGSWMLGLGPGPHLTSKDYKRPPPAKFEAHNTILDLFTQGGIIAVFSFVWLLATTSFVAYRAGLTALATLVCALGVFSMFHLIVRQPIFWFSIALCLAAAEAIRKAPADRGRTS
jgi:O-antigen ligase